MGLSEIPAASACSMQWWTDQPVRDVSRPFMVWNLHVHESIYIYIDISFDSDHAVCTIEVAPFS